MPRAPPSKVTSTSTVGLPRESRTWRAWTRLIDVANFTSWKSGVSPEQMREIDRATEADYGVSPLQLMEVAGRARPPRPAPPRGGPPRRRRGGGARQGGALAPRARAASRGVV